MQSFYPLLAPCPVSATGRLSFDARSILGCDHTYWLEMVEDSRPGPLSSTDRKVLTTGELFAHSCPFHGAQRPQRIHYPKRFRNPAAQQQYMTPSSTPSVLHCVSLVVPDDLSIGLFLYIPVSGDERRRRSGGAYRPQRCDRGVRQGRRVVARLVGAEGDAGSRNTAGRHQLRGDHKVWETRRTARWFCYICSQRFIFHGLRSLTNGASKKYTEYRVHACFPLRICFRLSSVS